MTLLVGYLYTVIYGWNCIIETSSVTLSIAIVIWVQNWHWFQQLWINLYLKGSCKNIFSKTNIFHYMLIYDDTEDSRVLETFFSGMHWMYTSNHRLHGNHIKLCEQGLFLENSVLYKSQLLSPCYHWIGQQSEISTLWLASWFAFSFVMWMSLFS